jgi:hypothetical protein
MKAYFPKKILFLGAAPPKSKMPDREKHSPAHSMYA